MIWKKGIGISLLILAVVIYSIVPAQHVSADVNEANKLFSSELTTELEAMGTQLILMKTYALSLLKQHNIELEQIPTLASHQTTARNNAVFWLDNIQPIIIQNNENIVSFSNKFDNYFPILLELASTVSSSEQDKANFVLGMNELKEEIDENYEQLHRLRDNFQQYSNALQLDHANFKSDSEEAEQLLNDEEGTIQALQDQIESINNDLQTNFEVIAGGAVSVVSGVALVVVGTSLFLAGGNPSSPAIIIGGVTAIAGGSIAIGYATDQVIQLKNELKDATVALTSAEYNAASLALLQAQVDNFVYGTDDAITALNGLEQTWLQVSNGFAQFIDDVNNGVDVDSQFLKEQLTEAKQNWDDLAEKANHITSFGQMNYEEDNE
ncbi:HBL/NHE enterotoxin family protein [Longirhabdus pacifica]|uniref:HBL/NHE enterotoxin family protein n=1 Tax=Longirhabdus pacifica TaxID=2305227 RepID=UPI0010092F28|nr:HBL/NHE enterotoxin family protein [Longirhabdus pacifica]